MKIVGTTVGTSTPRANLKQDNPKKADYVIGKDEYLDAAVAAALKKAKESGEFDGEPGYTPQKGIDYTDGKDGYTPVKGVDYFDGKDGRDGVDGKPGADGYTPVKGKDYFDGEKGENGKSIFYCKSSSSGASSGTTSSVPLSFIQNGDREIAIGDLVIDSGAALWKVTAISSSSVTMSFLARLVTDGEDGEDGVDGQSVFYLRYSGTAKQDTLVGAVTAVTGDRELNVGDLFISTVGYLYEFTGYDDRGNLNIKYLAAMASNGKDGKTPEKGVDYWTDADKTEIVDEVLEQTGGTLELIETIEVTEDMKIDRTAEPDGTAYNFKNVFIRIKTTSTSLSGQFIYFYSGKVQAARAWLQGRTTAPTYASLIHIEPYYGYWRSTYTSWGQNLLAEAADAFTMAKKVNDYPSITRIISQSTITAGTTIEIWGVRA